jgi:hypothetical protein
MKRTAAVLVLAIVANFTSPAVAIDHKNLDEGRPLRLEDAYAIANGELAVEVGAGGVFERRGPNRAVFPIELLYGLPRNLQLSIGSFLATDPRDIDDQEKAGDVRLSVLYNLNQETLRVPAFAGKVSLNLPTGVDSSGVDVELKGIATKSIDRLSIHLNGGYRFLNGTERDERDGRYEIAVGASYPIGAPKHTRTIVIGDVFTEQSKRRGASNTVGLELGVRHQLTPRLVLDGGVGSEIAGPGDRAPLFLNVGVSFGF